MNREKRAFEEALKRDRYDELTHRAYADWLDENGEDDLSNFHRNWSREWQKSEDWLRNYADEVGKFPDYYGEDEAGKVVVSYERIMEAAHKCLDEGRDIAEIALPYDTPDEVYQTEDFWKHFEVVTGRKVDEDMKEETFIRCAC